MYLKIVLVIAALFSGVGIGIASDLPDCPSSGYFHNCFGTYTFSDGTKYVGEFKDGKYNGQGTFTWSDGEKYVGEYKDGKIHGQGTYIFAPNSEWAGDKYVGEYRDGKRNGQGTYTWSDGEKYVGEYKDDKLHGQGTYTYLNGDKYVGMFKDDKRNGQGTYTYSDGTVQEGIWKDDEFQYAQKLPANSSPSGTSKLDKHKEFCKEIGFNPGTEKFGDCVLKMMDKD